MPSVLPWDEMNVCVECALFNAEFEFVYSGFEKNENRY